MKNTCRHIIYAFIFFISCICLGQNYSYKSINSSLESNFTIFMEYARNNKDIDALDYFPKNLKVDGSVDYTKELQKSIDENDRIIIPDFPILINEKGLKIKSNKVLIFQKNSLIIFKGPANGKFSDILKIYDVENIVILNPRIKGSRNYNGQNGEWSAGISIINSNNVKIFNAYISDTWGDGIFIGSENGKKSSNIEINGGVIDNSRRNGISITSASNLLIKNMLIANTNGTAPQCGIDIEPSLDSEVLEKIKILDNQSYNNKLCAFAINLSNFNSETYLKKKVDILIDNFTDNNSGNFVILSFNPNKKKYTVGGNVILNNLNAKNIKSFGIWKDSNKTNINLIKGKIIIKN